ncbi:MAG: hypothetical protein KF799_00245 [Bdellovibrionales bacterium]|nr:hypothetical protein [Bdellovibrionales bacterium]
MQRLLLMAGIAGLIMLGLYFAASKPVAPAPPPAASPRPQAPPPSPPPAPVAAHIPPRTVPVPAPVFTPPPQSLKNQYLRSGKLKLELTRLFQNRRFTGKNPEMNLQMAAQNRAANDKMVLPSNLPLRYELLAKCEQAPKNVELSRQEQRWIKIMPVFVNVKLVSDTTVGILAAQISREPCVREVTSEHPNTIVQPQQFANDYRRIADDAVSKVRAKGKAPRVQYVGTLASLLKVDPILADENPKTTKLMETPGVYTMISGQAVPVLRRAVQIKARSRDGKVTDSAVSMGIVRSVNNKADLIVLDIQNYDPEDHESALAYAAKAGAVVVNNVPFPVAAPGVKSNGTGSALASPAKKSLLDRSKVSGAKNGERGDRVGRKGRGKGGGANTGTGQGNGGKGKRRGGAGNNGKSKS